MRAILKQPDGKLLLGGEFRSPSNYIVRLNVDGSVDSDFVSNVGAAFNAPVLALALDAQGNIVAGGEFSDFAGLFSSRIALLKPDGTLDNNFREKTGQGFNDKVSSVAVQSDGKILAVGNFTEFDAATVVRAARLNPDGTFDASYGAAAQPPAGKGK